MDFFRGSQGFFQGCLKMMKFHFTHSKLKEQAFLLKIK